MAASDSAPAVIVFGGSGTLGRCICRALARDGARVGFTYFENSAVADELSRELPNSVARKLDLTSLEELSRVLAELRSELGLLTGFVHAATLTSAAPKPK